MTVPVALVALTSAGGHSLVNLVIFGKKTMECVTVVLAEEIEVLKCRKGEKSPGCSSSAWYKST